MRVTTGDVYLQVHVCCNLLLMNSYGIFRLVAWPCVTMLREVATYALPSDRGYEPHSLALCIVPRALLPSCKFLMLQCYIRVRKKVTFEETIHCFLEGEPVLKGDYRAGG